MYPVIFQTILLISACSAKLALRNADVEENLGTQLRLEEALGLPDAPGVLKGQ